MDIGSARHMARAHARTWLRLLAGEAARRARIGDLALAGLDRCKDILFVAHHHGLEACREMALLHLARRILIDRMAFGLPFRKAAIEHRNIVMAEDAQHPPGA